MGANYTDKKLKDCIDAFDNRIKFYQQYNIPDFDRFQKIKWQESIYKKGYLQNNLDYAKDYILAHPYEFYKYSDGGKKDKIKLYLRLLKEKIKK